MTCTVAGYAIPKDSKVLFNAWAIQRDPEFWEDPLQFEPEKFLKDTEKGRRICAGIPMAERMMRHVLASMLHSFEWRLPEETKPEIHEKFGIVLKKMEPLVAIHTARLSNSKQYR
ncbi:hypothetical protein REPUB_Repub07fG0116700 [Reevesia pubescens]